MQGQHASRIVASPVAQPAPSARIDRGPNGKPISHSVVGGVVGIMDSFAVLGAGAASTIWASLHLGVDWHVATPIVLLGALAVFNLLQLAGAYRFRTLARLATSLGQIFGGWLIASAVVLALLYGVEPARISARIWLLLWFTGGLALLAATRIGLQFALLRWQRAGRLRRNVVVIGAGSIGQRLLRHLSVRRDPDNQLLGVYDDRLSRLPSHCMGHAILGTVDDLVRDAREVRIDTVIVALPLSADLRLAEIMNKLNLLPVDVRLCPDTFGFQLGTCQVRHIGGLSFLEAINNPLRGWRWVGKAIEDRVFAALILLLISPIMLAIALAIKLETPGPVFFKQWRYGLNNKLIQIYKFRTMHDHARDVNAEQLTRRNDPRVTRLGTFLRRYSLDELPQFINVLRGEMSVVGPRPHATAAKAGKLLYQDAVKYYDARHRMKPGITGWAQINGWRGETETVEQVQRRVEHDLYYIEHWTILLDLMIILRTIFGGFTGRLAY